MGDFNPQVCRKMLGEEKIMGHTFFGKRNKSGTLLTNCAPSKIKNTEHVLLKAK